MQLHSLTRVHKNKRPVTVGRGGKRGKTAGRGTKGQNARAGRKKRPELRDIIKKLPKLRGYRFASITPKPTTVSLRTLEKRMPQGGSVSPEVLVTAGILTSAQAANGVKLVGNTISIKVTVSSCAASAGARKAIAGAGGTIV